MGLVAALFFTSTFVVNRAVGLGGGSWRWAAALRYLTLLPVLAGVVALTGSLAAVGRALRSRPWAWMAGSAVGFGVFYVPLAYASATTPSWVVAGTWQTTIVMGMLLAPLLYRDHRRVVPRRALATSAVVLGGVVLVQVGAAEEAGLGGVLVGALPVLVAAVAYPLGNRFTMELAGGRLQVFERILAMVVASLPVWVGLAAVAWLLDGPPTARVAAQGLLVAVTSGVVATGLFFQATQWARHDGPQLAAVEATAAAQVVFAAVAEATLLGGAWPAPVGWLGIAVICAGLVTHVRAVALR